MPLTRKRATIWTCSDGKEFYDFQKAADYQAKLDLAELVNEVFVDKDILFRTDVYDNLLRHRAKFAKLLGKHRSRIRKEARPADREAGKS